MSEYEDEDDFNEDEEWEDEFDDFSFPDDDDC